MLIGVGGSGKRSLARLAAFLSSFDVYQVSLKSNYNENDFKADFNNLYRRSGLKGLPCVFLLSDAQIVDEHFLVSINDFLSSGQIFGLFTDDEQEEIFNSIRSEAKLQGFAESNETLWKYFIDKVRRNLKLVLCFSPVGNILRIRARRFPALFSGTMIDWFHSWPQNALQSVAARFLAEFPTSIAQFMASTHVQVNQVSQEYFLNERRSYYTTPKTFLEYIQFFRHVYEKNQDKIQLELIRLHSGLEKLGSISAQTQILQENLKVTTIEVNTKAERAETALKVVTAEADKVAKEKVCSNTCLTFISWNLCLFRRLPTKNVEKSKRKKPRLRKFKKFVLMNCSCRKNDFQRFNIFPIFCYDHFRSKAEPVLEAARQALEKIDKSQLTELKSFASPPETVKFVMNMVVVLFKWVDEGRIIPESQRTWTEAKNTIGPVEKFVQRLRNFQVGKVSENEENISLSETKRK